MKCFFAFWPTLFGMITFLSQRFDKRERLSDRKMVVSKVFDNFVHQNFEENVSF